MSLTDYPLKEFVTATQAASIRGVTVWCVYQALRTGRLAGHKISPHVWLIHQDDLMRWDEAARQNPRGGTPSHRQ